MGKKRWFPFTAVEVEVALAVLGFLATALSLSRFDIKVVALASFGSLIVVYLMGLLVYACKSPNQFQFIREGGVRGNGYRRVFRSAQKCVFLMHVDDDPPSEELLGIYRELLERGVQVRRIVFLRPDAKPQSYEWIVEFGDHKNLQQCVVLPDSAEVMRFSFALIDEKQLLIAVPGYKAVETAPYTTELVLRHLLSITDEEVASVFLKIHHQMWERSRALRTSSELTPILKKIGTHHLDP